MLIRSKILKKEETYLLALQNEYMKTVFFLVYSLFTSLFVYAQDNSEYPIIIDSIISERNPKKMIKIEYNSPLNDEIRKMKGTTSICCFMDSTKSYVFKVIQKWVFDNSSEYILFHFVDNHVVKTESWVVKNKKIFDFAVSYYKGGEIVFPGEKNENGTRRESYAYLADMYVKIFLLE